MEALTPSRRLCANASGSFLHQLLALNSLLLALRQLSKDFVIPKRSGSRQRSAQRGTRFRWQLPIRKRPHEFQR